MPRIDYMDPGGQWRPYHRDAGDLVHYGQEMVEQYENADNPYRNVYEVYKLLKKYYPEIKYYSKLFWKASTNAYQQRDDWIVRMYQKLATMVPEKLPNFPGFRWDPNVPRKRPRQGDLPGSELSENSNDGYESDSSTSTQMSDSGPIVRGQKIKPPQYKMSSKTSVPATMMTVDLGNFKCPGLGGDHRVPKESLGPKRTLIYSRSGLYNSSGFSQSFHAFGEVNLPEALPSVNQKVENAYDGSAYSESNGYGMGINNVGSLMFVEDAWKTFEGTTDEFLRPQYEGNGAGAFSMRDSERKVILKNQYVRMHIKNTTANGAESCLMFTVYMYQSKEDIYRKPAAAYKYPLDDAIADGFSSLYTLGTNLQTFDTTHIQPYYVTLDDNEFLREKCLLVDSKSACLCPGQEAIMGCFLKKPQIQSFNYQQRGMPFGTGADDYILPTYKRGEYFFVLRFNGNMARASKTGPPTEYALDPMSLVQATYFMYKRFDYHTIRQSDKTPLMSNANAQKSLGAGFSYNDIDPDVNFK